MKALTPWTRKQSVGQRREEEYPLYSLQREMNSLFNEFFRGFEVAPWSFSEEAMGEYVPRIDMHETDKEITVSAELPGMNAKDVSITLTKDVLTISGEKRSETTEDAKGHYKMERIYGAFRRSIVLPMEVDHDRCDATFKNGILNINLPKAAEHQRNSKGIPIKKG